MSEGKKTRLVTAGRNKKWTLGVVNPPVQRASTVVFDTVAQKTKRRSIAPTKPCFTDVVAPQLTSLFKKQWLRLKAAQVACSTPVAQRPSPTRFSLLLHKVTIS